MKIKLSSFLQWKGNVYLYRKFGWELAFRYLVILAAFYFLVNKKEKQEITEAIENTFGDRKNKSEMKNIRKGVFDGIFAHYYEKLYNAYENNGDLAAFFQESVEAESLHKLDTALEKGKGILFVTGHYGGIEYIPIFIAMKGYPISVVAKFATPQLKETLYNKTKDLGLRIIDADEEKSVMGAIIRELRANRIVFFECDEIEEHIQEDIILPKVEVTKYLKHHFWCGKCKKVVSGKGKNEMPNSFIGPQAKSIAAFLKYVVKVSNRDIKKIFKELCGLTIVPSSISGFNNQARKKCIKI